MNDHETTPTRKTATSTLGFQTREEALSERDDARTLAKQYRKALAALLDATDDLPDDAHVGVAAALEAVLPALREWFLSELDVTAGEHVVNFTENGWTLQHPLSERLDGSLFECEWNDLCHNLDGPPAEGPGEYVATLAVDGPVFVLRQEQP